MLGPCAGGAAYSPALTDFIFAVRDISQMFITGPDVVRAVTGEEISQNGLGGADVHGAVSGVAHFVHDDKESCLAEVRYLLSLLPSNNRELPPRHVSGDPGDRHGDALLDLVPHDGNRSYDMRGVVEELVDDERDYVEVHAGWAPNIVCALARIDGHTVGIVANQPAAMAGVLDIKASEKAGAVGADTATPSTSRWSRWSTCPASCRVWTRSARASSGAAPSCCTRTATRPCHGCRWCCASDYGGAYIVMDSRSIGADIALAWPTNEIAVMGAEGAANVVFRREIAAADDPDAMRQEKIDQYKEELVHPYYAAERGLVDDVIDPRETRGGPGPFARHARSQRRRAAAPQARQPAPVSREETMTVQRPALVPVPDPAPVPSPNPRPVRFRIERGCPSRRSWPR